MRTGFFCRSRVLFSSQQTDFEEERFVILSKSDQERLLTVVYKTWGSKIRVISAGDMSQDERRVYSKKSSEISE